MMEAPIPNKSGTDRALRVEQDEYLKPARGEDVHDGRFAMVKSAMCSIEPARNEPGGIHPRLRATSRDSGRRKSRFPCKTGANRANPRSLLTG
jgi:hypothetical protein